MKYSTPGTYAVQFVTDAPGRLDFVTRDATSLDDAFGYAREAIATHPEFKWNGLIIWKDMSSDDLRRMTAEMEAEGGSS